MRNRDVKVLCELLKNGRISDRELAKKLDTSQSTVTRARHRLEKKEILSYIAVPNLPSLGINLLVFTFGRVTKLTPQITKSYYSKLRKDPQIIFTGRGEGMRKTGFAVSLHPDFSDYADHVRVARLDPKGILDGVESFFIPTVDFIKYFEIGKAVEFILKKKSKK